MSDLQIPQDEIKHTALVGKDNLGSRIFHVETIGGAHYILKVDKFGKGQVIAVAPHRAISKSKAEKAHSIQWDTESDLFKAEPDDQTKNIANLISTIKSKDSEIQQLKDINPDAFDAIVGITNELIHILKTTKDVNIKDVQNDKDFDDEVDSHLKEDQNGQDQEDSQVHRVSHAKEQHNVKQEFAPGAVRHYDDQSEAVKQPDGSWKKLPKTGIATAKSENTVQDLDKTQPKIRFPQFKDISTRPDQDVHIVKDKQSTASFMKKYLNQAKDSRKSPQHQYSYQKGAKDNASKLMNGKVAGLNLHTMGGPKPLAVVASPENRSITSQIENPSHSKALEYAQKLNEHLSNLDNKTAAAGSKYKQFKESRNPDDLTQYRLLHADYKKELKKEPKKVKLSLNDYKKEINKQSKTGSVNPKLIDDVRTIGNTQNNTIEHESLHNMLGSMEKKHGTKFRSQIVNQLLSQHSPEDVKAISDYVKEKGYKPNNPSFNEEVLAHSRDVLTNGFKFKHYLKDKHGTGMSEEEKENFARKRINSIKSGHKKVIAYANKLKPEDVTVKSEALNKNIEDSTLMHGNQDINHNLMNWVYGQDGLDLDGPIASWIVQLSLQNELSPKLTSMLKLCAAKHHEDNGFVMPNININDSAEDGLNKLLQAKSSHDEAANNIKSLIKPNETTNIILDNKDGTGWYNIGKNLQSEATAMNHDCDTDCRKGDTVLSLRRIINGYHQPMLTAVANNGYITSIKGPNGYKPDSNWEQIKNLLLDSAVQGTFEDHDAVHSGFRFQDMPIVMQQGILDIKPNIDTITSKDKHDDISESHKDVHDAIEYANIKRSANPTGWRQDVIEDYRTNMAPKLALMTLGKLTSEEYTQLGINNG